MTTAAAEAGETSKDFLGMSDDDFLKINSPDKPADTEESQGETPGSAASASEDNTQEPSKDAGTDSAPAQASGDTGDSGAAPGSVVSVPDNQDESGAKPEKSGKKDKAQAADKAAEDAGKTDAEPAKDEAQPVNYENFFKQVMTPFKANGRTIELKTPEEAIRLMQMGAGYGRKIQDLQPHLKVIRMLEKNQLLDESKLSFLIDINQKNPDAIKKIIKDAGIDPLDLNTEDNVSYSPNNHSVSDAEMTFHNALGDIQSHPSGVETLRVINQTWDQQSKSALWDKPEILGIIQTQRDTGVYDQIVAEMDRQKLLGHIPNSTPFLQAYKAAGDHLIATNGFKGPEAQTPQIQNQSGNPQQPQVIATRAATPKAQVQNSEKAAAASSPKTSQNRKAGAFVNPLQMPDDEFLKQFEGRL